MFWAVVLFRIPSVRNIKFSDTNRVDYLSVYLLLFFLPVGIFDQQNKKCRNSPLI